MTNKQFIPRLAVAMLLLHAPGFGALAESVEETTWYSAGSKPDIEVSIREAAVVVTVWDNIPSVNLQFVNRLLFDTYGEQYVRIQDFNDDGVTDVGVLQGSSLGGSHMCYAVYEYLPHVYSFNYRSSFTWCDQ